jgi:hypothetical protein
VFPRGCKAGRQANEPAESKLWARRRRLVSRADGPTLSSSSPSFLSSRLFFRFVLTSLVGPTGGYSPTAFLLCDDILSLGV